MRFSSLVEISSMRPQLVLMLWLATALLLPRGEVQGAPTQAMTTGRPSRGDRTVPPLGSIDGDATTEALLDVGDGNEGLISERTRREAKEAAESIGGTSGEGPATDFGGRLLSSSSRQSGWGSQGHPSGNSSPKTRRDSRKVHKPDSDEDYYYYYYYDSFVEGVTTREDLDDYSETGAPIDQEDGDDDSDDGEIMELLNLTPRQKTT